MTQLLLGNKFQEKGANLREGTLGKGSKSK
jgi:hypothetical protein